MSRRVLARKATKWTVVYIFPDVCKTPIGSSMIPVPYPVTAELSDSEHISKNVNANGSSVFLFDKSTISKTKGDKAGVGKGVISNKVSGNCIPAQHGKTLRANGKLIVRDKDKFWMNV